jgi:hypothetical protein
MDPLNIYANNHIDPSLAWVLITILDLAFLALISAAIYYRVAARRMAEQATSRNKSRSTLRPGQQFVSGTVELAQDATFALRCTIELSGREIVEKNSVSHRFDEVIRHTESQPFYIKHASGERVYVVAENAAVLLVDQLDQQHWVSQTQRWIRAELTAGEPVIAEGILIRGHDPEAGTAAQGYRDRQQQGWVLSPKDNTLHFSTESLARRHELRASAFGRLIVLLLALWAAMQLPLATYRARQLLGQNVSCTLLRPVSWSTRSSKGQLIAHYALDVLPPQPGASVLRLEIDASDFVADNLTGREQVWVRFVSALPAVSELGQGNSVHAGAWFAALVMVVIGGAALIKTLRYRRWYETQYTKTGSGPLPTPTGERFAVAPPST